MTKTLILEDLDFFWESKDIKTVKKLWNKGKGIKEKADAVKREGDEVFLLLLDLSRKEKIDGRKNGILGVG